jgi:hypothetical protein
MAWEARFQHTAIATPVHVPGVPGVDTRAYSAHDDVDMATKERFVELLQPILDALGQTDVADPKAAELLAQRFPLDAPAMRELGEAFAAGVADGWLCDRQGTPGITYSRVQKALSTDALSVEAVRMQCPGPGHAHPNGEFDLCFAADGSPTFDGNAPGWTVYAPGSWHIPTVAGGTMNILYFLPGGAIQFGPKDQ